jgi:hypothetical protein
MNGQARCVLADAAPQGRRIGRFRGGLEGPAWGSVTVPMRTQRPCTGCQGGLLDTAAGWTTPGWHNWVHGWKLRWVTTVAEVWIPLAADLTPATTADNEHAPALLQDLPAAVAFVLGDTHDQAPDLHQLCAAQGRVLGATQRGAYPRHDDGVEVRRIFQRLRSHAIENLNGQFKGSLTCQGRVPTRGLMATRRFILGAILVYQAVLAVALPDRRRLPGGPQALPESGLTYL